MFKFFQNTDTCTLLVSNDKTGLVLVKKKNIIPFIKGLTFFSENNYRLLIGGHHLVIVKMLSIQNDIFVINFALTAAWSLMSPSMTG